MQQTINTLPHRTEHNLDRLCTQSIITNTSHAVLKLFILLIQHGGTLDWSKVYSLCRQTKGVLHYVCVSLLIPLYPLCCSQSSAMTSLHLSWQVTVLRQRSTQQGSLNLPTICQFPKTSSVMSSPPRQSRWHIKFVSGNSVEDYNLIQHCPEQKGGVGNYYNTARLM